MKFVDEFMAEVKAKRSTLSSMLSEDYVNNLETKVGAELDRHWHQLPKVRNLKEREFAVDGSMAHRSLANGTDLFFARSLLIGDKGKLERKKFRFEALRALENPDEVSRFLRLLMGYLEVQAIIENIEELVDSVVLMDGSLYGKFTHYYREIVVSGFENLPLRLISSMEELFRLSRENDILLIGISKYSRSRIFSRALAEKIMREEIPTAILPSDMEIIYRWRKEKPGFTTPLLLGSYSVSWEMDKLSKQPESFLKKYFPNISADEAEWGKRTLGDIPEAPAIAVSYVLPEAGETPLRLDVPVDLLGDERKIGTVSPYEFADPMLISQVIGHLLASRGGREVYNALLYVADREVRLTGDVVDSVYKSIIRGEVVVPIEYDRGMRRFFE